VFILPIVILHLFFSLFFFFFSLTKLSLCTFRIDSAVLAKIAEMAYEKEVTAEGEPDLLKKFKNCSIWTVCSMSLFVLGVSVGY
jgi:hypothetical protein